MKLSNILGLIVFSVGVLVLAGVGLYKFFEDSEVLLVVKGGISAVILGVVIVLISLVRERLKEKKHDTYKFR